jgi:glycosyltransferase involved in cell wall biosynthesis
MRVLIVHNRYRSTSPSGENVVVEQDIARYRGGGHEVRAYIRDSDEIAGFSLLARLTLPLRPIFSLTDALALRRVMRDWRPDLLHLHNPFPLISPWVLRTAAAARVPVVQTIHNHRHACVAGTLFRDGQTCTDCIGRRIPVPAVRHGCYQGSRLRTVPMALAQVLHRSTWRKVSQFLAVSAGTAATMRRIGVEPSRIEIRPNLPADPGPPDPPGEGFLFVGRLSPEKGIGLLLDAWQMGGLGSSSTLTIVGDGPESDRARHAAAQDPSIRVLGLRPPGEVAQLMRAGAVVVVPSVGHEADPLVILEAQAHGRPVIAFDVGSVRETVGEGGWIIRTSAQSLADALVQVVSNTTEVERKGRIARSQFELRRARLLTRNNRG